MKLTSPCKWFESIPDNPFYQPRKPLWLPPEMATPPVLDDRRPERSVARRQALLINPFYAKSPHGSFGKHVLTPSLALTAIAGATPSHWKVRYWDENLLQGPPPADPPPEVVGISVHLTFAKRAYQLARWYRARGSKVVFGGLHIQSCPDEAAPHADAIAVGDGVQLWPTILKDIETGALKRRYHATYESAYQLDPEPRRDLVARDSFLTTTSLIATRGCHNRCGFCYLYKRSNRLWHFLIKRRLVRQVWWPLVELTRRRHVAYRKRLVAIDPLLAELAILRSSRDLVPAGV